MRERLYLAIISLIFVLVPNIAVAESKQETIFCVEFVSFGKLTGESKCNDLCSKYSRCEKETRLSGRSGRKILSSETKKIVKEEWQYMDTRGIRRIDPTVPLQIGQFGCTCNGTEYVLEEPENKPTGR